MSWRGLLTALLVASATGEIAHAGPVPIPDFSFENTTIIPGGATAAPNVGTNWTAWGESGVFLQDITNEFFIATSTNTLPPTADGTNYLTLNVGIGHNGYCWQDLGPLQPNTVYTLTIALGQSLQANTGQGYIGLINGKNPYQTLLASTPVDNSLVPGGAFADSTVVFTTGGQVSGDLTVLMAGTNGTQLLFDNVRLDATAAPQAATALPPGLSSPSGTVYVGTVVTLSENPAGATPFTYQWLSDNGTSGATFSPISGATSANYAVDTSTLSAGSAIEYEVVVANGSGSSTSSPVTLNIISGQPVIVQDTLPSTGSADVIGGQVTFTAAFDGNRPLAYQWQVDYGSGPGPIAGATNATLTLTNLQLTDTGSYSVTATDSLGTTNSTPSAFTVSPPPAPDANGVIVSAANQYGLGGTTEFTPTWVIASNSLIRGELPSVTTGNFQEEAAGGVPTLTDGTFGTLFQSGNSSIFLATCGQPGAGSVLIYPLPASANGYDLTNIIVYGGWSDGGRDQQSYSVYYSTIAAPTNFDNELTTVNYLPSPNDPNTDQSATRISLTAPNGGAMIHNIAAIEFYFGLLAGGFNENGYEGYAEFQIFGTPSAPAPILTLNTQPVTGSDVVGSAVTFRVGVSSSIPLSYQWYVDNGSGPTAIAGANSTTLTLTNLQLTDTGSYHCVAANSTGSITSAPSSFVVNPDNAPDGFGVVAAPANQTGNGPTFTPTWPIAPGSLIAGTLPITATPSANAFGAEGAGALPVLTDGVFGTVGSANNAYAATCGQNAGQTVTYALTGSEGGYNLTNIVLYGGWSDGGRDEQAYTIYYATATAPTSFVELTSYDYIPTLPGAVPNATRVSYTSGIGLPLATNVAYLEIDFTNPNGGGENGYEGYNEISVYGTPSAPVALPPVLRADTLPTTGSDVVGSSVTFTAAFASSSPISYQWLVDNGNGAGLTPIPNATSTTLTLNNLQLTDTGSYSLTASNALGVASSTPNTFTVNPAPAPVNNILISDALQTYSGLAFTPTWAAPSGSLIAGSLPSAVGTGDFTNQYTGGIPVLTDGKIGPIGGNDGTAMASCGGTAGTTLTYTLAGSAAGYDLSSIVTYGGWNDGGRDEQAYTISYSTVAAPTTFTVLTPADYLPTIPGAVANSTRQTITSGDGTPLATHVAKVEFNFTTPNGGGENGWQGYSELSLFGTPSASTTPPTIGSTTLSGGNLVLAGTGGTPGGGYTWLTSTNVAAPLSTWTTNSTGVFSANGAFSNAFPVTPGTGRFFLLRIP